MQRIKLYGLIVLVIVVIFFVWVWNSGKGRKYLGDIQKSPVRQEMDREIVSNVDTQGSIIAAKPVISPSEHEAFVPKLVVESNSPLPARLSTNETASSNIRDILKIISNTFGIVDGILKNKNYKLMEFSQTYWVVTEEPSTPVTWRIYFGKTNLVSTIEKDVYQDEQRNARDISKSYIIMLHRETNLLASFRWRDGHEVIRFSTNGNISRYALEVGKNKDYEVKWDEYGNIVSEKVTDWSKRGKPIGKEQGQQQIPSRLYPTSSVEAATESWRQKQK